MSLTEEEKKYLQDRYQIDVETCDLDYLCDFLMKELEEKQKKIALNSEKIALMEEVNQELEKMIREDEF